MTARTTSRLLAALAAGALVLTLAACGDDDDSDADATDGTTEQTTAAEDETRPAGEADEVTVTATDNAFDVTEVSVAPGEEVHLANSGSNPHTITSDDAGVFDTGTVSGGSEGELVAPSEPGTYAFHCDIHPAAMTGTLTVE